MNLREILKQHQLSLDQAHAALTSPNNAHDVNLPLEHKRRRIIELSERIAELFSQKASALRRYDDAISRHKDELARLQSETANDEKIPQQPVEPPIEKPVEQTKTASEPIKAAASRPPKPPARRPTKTAKKSRKPKT